MTVLTSFGQIRGLGLTNGIVQSVHDVRQLKITVHIVRRWPLLFMLQ
jgi:hypothetical protein